MGLRESLYIEKFCGVTTVVQQVIVTEPCLSDGQRRFVLCEESATAQHCGCRWTAHISAVCLRACVRAQIACLCVRRCVSL